MSRHAAAHVPVGGPILTRPFLVLLAIAGVGAIVTVWRFVAGIGAVSNLSNGYPWGVWIAVDVVVGTALGCGGFAVGLLVYVLNRGRYHPLVRPAVLTSLLGYGLAVVAVSIDLGRYWGLWKVPVFVWRWTHSPQLEVALCVATYVLVLLVEMSPAAFEKWSADPTSRLRGVALTGSRIVGRILLWVLALGLLLPAMHQSSLGTMMLLPGPRMHPLWFTPWLPLLFLVNCLIIGYAVVVLESHVSAAAFNRRRETAMLGALSRIVAWVALAWTVFRVGEVIVAGDLATVTDPEGLAFLAEVGLTLAGALLMLSPTLRSRATWQVRAAILLLLGGVTHRIATYLIAFDPGPHYRYFPSVPELLITFGIIAAEIAIYIAAVKTFPILGGARHE